MSASQFTIAVALLAFVSSPRSVIGDDALPPSEKSAAKGLPALVQSVKQDRKIRGSPVVELELESVPTGPFNFRDEHVGLLKQFRHLRTLRLSAQLTDAGIAELCELRSLTSLKLENCEFTDSGLAKLAALDKLTALRLFLCKNVTGDGLASLTQLEELRISGCKGVTRLPIRPLQRLAHLAIWKCDSLTGDDLGDLKDLPHLTDLKLLECPKIVGSELLTVTSLPQLTHLNLTFHYEVADAGLTQITGLRDLDLLSLHGTLIPDAGLAAVRELRKLTSLSLSSHVVTNDGIQVVKDLPNLTALQMKCKQVTAAGLAVLHEIPRLESLELEECWEFDDAEMAEIRACKHLKKLVLADGGDKITAAGMAGLQDLRDLEVLVLEGHFTITALREILKLRTLRVLQLDLPRKTPVTEFRDALSSTDIFWRNREKHGPGPWYHESISPRRSQPLADQHEPPWERSCGLVP